MPGERDGLRHHRWPAAVKMSASCGLPWQMVGDIVGSAALTDCLRCRKVAELSKVLATRCGCRRPEIHTGVARAAIKISMGGHRT